MNKITIALFDQESNIMLDSIEAMLSLKDDFQIVHKYYNLDNMMSTIKDADPHILIINIYTFSDKLVETIKRLNELYPKIKTLIISMNLTNENVFRIIKTGAKGYLTKNTSKEELTEAIYTLRNGYDYFSKPISEILLSNYLNSIKDNKPVNQKHQEILSKREIEILQLWGDSHTNKEIADKLFISVRTVESHKNHIMQKLNLKTTVDMIKFAIKNNIIKLD